MNTKEKTPFLAEFYDEQRGSVLFPIDPPYRSRDSQALARLERILPWTDPVDRIEDKPVPVPKERRAYYRRDDIENRLREIGGDAGDALVSQYFEKEEKEEQLPEDVLCPELPLVGPILIIGRPEVMIPSKSKVSEPGALTLKDVLKAAKYHSRRYGFITNNVEHNDYRTLLDRRTGKVYRTSKDELANRKPKPGNSYGFLFHTHLQFRSLTVIAGSCAFATWGVTYAITDPDIWPGLLRRGGGISSGCRFEALIRVKLHKEPEQGRSLELNSSNIEIVAASQETMNYGCEKHDVSSMLCLFRGEKQPTSDELTNATKFAELENEFKVLYQSERTANREHRVVVADKCKPPENGSKLVGGTLIQRKVTQLKEVAALGAGEEKKKYPLLVTGASGTGKELAARIVWSERRKKKPGGKYSPINCAAIGEGVIESELFGHIKGAFTGATSKKDGVFIEAGSGVAFLDEIGELPVLLQAKLLRALEEGAVRPVGTVTEQKYNAQVVAATNRSVMASGSGDTDQFRNDLLARFAHRVEMPLLSERRMDIPALILSICREHIPDLECVRIPEGALRALLAHDYQKSNVRELRRMIIDVFAHKQQSWRENRIAEIRVADLAPFGILEPLGIEVSEEEEDACNFRFSFQDDEIIQHKVPVRKALEQISRLMNSHKGTELADALLALGYTWLFKTEVKSYKTDYIKLIIQLREKGLLLEKISALFGAARATLSGWLREDNRKKELEELETETNELITKASVTPGEWVTHLGDSKYKKLFEYLGGTKTRDTYGLLREHQPFKNVREDKRSELAKCLKDRHLADPIINMLFGK